MCGVTRWDTDIEEDSAWRIHVKLYFFDLLHGEED
jgi:hypothetical protein